MFDAAKLRAMTQDRDYWRAAYERLVIQTGRDLNDGLGRDPRRPAPPSQNPRKDGEAGCWRSIESAPRDGTMIELAFIDRGRWIPHPDGYPQLGPMWETDESLHSDTDDAEQRTFNAWRPAQQAEEEG